MAKRPRTTYVPTRTEITPERFEEYKTAAAKRGALRVAVGERALARGQWRGEVAGVVLTVCRPTVWGEKATSQTVEILVDEAFRHMTEFAAIRCDPSNVRPAPK